MNQEREEIGSILKELLACPNVGVSSDFVLPKTVEELHQQYRFDDELTKKSGDNQNRDWVLESWLKAIFLSPLDSYQPELAHEILGRYEEAEVENSLQCLVDDGIITKAKKDKHLRGYSISKNSLMKLNKITWNADVLNTTITAKKRLLSDDTTLTPVDPPAGEVAATLELALQNQISLTPDIPNVQEFLNQAEEKARRRRVGVGEETVETFLARAKQDSGLMENESFTPECHLHTKRIPSSLSSTSQKAAPRVLAPPTSIDQISKQPSDLSQWIENKGEIGCLVSEIEREFSAISSSQLPMYLNTLQASGDILKIDQGGESYYVHKKNAERSCFHRTARGLVLSPASRQSSTSEDTPTSPNQINSSTSSLGVIRPWIKFPSGEVDRDLLKKFQFKVYSIVLSKPGIQEEALKSLIPLCTPHDVKELLLNLEEKGVIYSKTVAFEKPSLFSSPDRIELVTTTSVGGPHLQTSKLLFPSLMTTAFEKM
eukprot:TRINITY_DN15581_c0_g1_i1.p1 TRINITY_DN15581_c0_g1~~TRINITY_DN15581_c0_g1_i1.p1  ORF type:complete len:494 (-),score=97.28 TRINITY_DN15581_c0_g1_i1:58-1518(-)